MRGKIGLAKGSLLTFFSNILIFILSLIVSIIIARTLGPTNKGIYVLIMLFPTLFMKLGTVGVEAANVYFSGNRKYSIAEISNDSIFLGLVIGVILIPLFGIISHLEFFQKFIYNKGINLLYIWLAMFRLPLSLISLFHHSILVGREKILQFNGLNIFRVILDIVLVPLFLFVFKLSILGLIFWGIITTIVMCSLKIYFVNKLKQNKRFSLNIALLRESLKYGIKAHLGNIAQFLNYRLDMFLVAYFLAVKELGYYSLAVGLAEKLWMIPGAITTVLFPRISSLSSDEANNLTPKVARITLFTVSSSAIILLFLSRYLIKFFYGVAYLPSVKPFTILLPGIVALSVCKIITADLAGRGRPEFGTFAAYISLGANLPLNLLLIPKWGISGAAFSSTISYVLATLVVFCIFLKVSGNSLVSIVLLKRKDIEKFFLPILRKIRLMLKIN